MLITISFYYALRICARDAGCGVTRRCALCYLQRCDEMRRLRDERCHERCGRCRMSDCQITIKRKMRDAARYAAPRGAAMRKDARAARYDAVLRYFTPTPVMSYSP